MVSTQHLLCCGLEFNPWSSNEDSVSRAAWSEEKERTKVSQTDEVTHSRSLRSQEFSGLKALMWKLPSTEVLKKPPHQDSPTELAQGKKDANQWTKNPETGPGNLV